MRKKMPPRPYYGELEPGETLPAQSKKPKKVVTKPIKKPGGPKGIGAKTVGGIKESMSKRQKALADALGEGATSGRASKHEKDMYGK